MVVNGQVSLGAGSKVNITAADQILAAAGSVINAPGVNLNSGSAIRTAILGSMP